MDVVGIDWREDGRNEIFVFYVSICDGLFERNGGMR